MVEMGWIPFNGQLLYMSSGFSAVVHLGDAAPKFDDAMISTPCILFLTGNTSTGSCTNYAAGIHFMLTGTPFRWIVVRSVVSPHSNNDYLPQKLRFSTAGC
jgi:hypothetical protein